MGEEFADSAARFARRVDGQRRVIGREEQPEPARLVQPPVVVVDERQHVLAAAGPDQRPVTGVAEGDGEPCGGRLVELAQDRDIEREVPGIRRWRGRFRGGDGRIVGTGAGVTVVGSPDRPPKTQPASAAVDARPAPRRNRRREGSGAGIDGYDAGFRPC